MTPLSQKEPMPELDLARMETPELLANADAVIDAASAKLSALCHGERWTMSIPVQNSDSDIPLGAVIRLAVAVARRSSPVAQPEETRTTVTTGTQQGIAIVTGTHTEHDGNITISRSEYEALEATTKAELCADLLASATECERLRKKLRDRQSSSPVAQEQREPGTAATEPICGHGPGAQVCEWCGDTESEDVLPPLTADEIATANRPTPQGRVRAAFDALDRARIELGKAVGAMRSSPASSESKR